MSKSINFGKMSQGTIFNLNNYSKAVKTLEDMQKQLKIANEKLAEIQEKRNKAFEEDKLTRDEIIKKYPLSKQQKEVNSIIEAMKPHKEAMKKATGFVPVGIYEAYKLAMLKGNIRATGSLEVTSGKKSKMVEIKEGFSFKDCVISYVRNFGTDCFETVTDKNIEKVATTLLLRCSGMRKNNKGTTLSTYKSKQGFHDLFIRVVIDYLVYEKGVLDRAEDGSITRHQF